MCFHNQVIFWYNSELFCPKTTLHFIVMQMFNKYVANMYEWHFKFTLNRLLLYTYVFYYCTEYGIYKAMSWGSCADNHAVWCKKQDLFFFYSHCLFLQMYATNVNLIWWFNRLSGVQKISWLQIFISWKASICLCIPLYLIIYFLRR